MTVKDLVLTSLESFNDFEVNGKRLTQETYLELAYNEVDSYYLDVDENNQAYMVIKLVG